MQTYKVLFLPHRKETVVNEGESLIRAAMDAGVHINASCGGEGVCGKCRVVVESGTVAGGITEKLDAKDREDGVRQACLASVVGDVTIRIPLESTMDSTALNLQGTPRKTARIKQMDLN